MNKRLWTALAVAALTAVGAEAYLGQIEASFPSPAGTDTRGLARADDFLYAVDGGAPGTVYRMNVETGSVSGRYVVGWMEVNSGLGYSANPAYLWVGCVGSNRVYQVRPLTGSVYSFWKAAHKAFGVAAQCTGDGGKGTSNIYAADNYPAFIYRHRLDGSVAGSFPIGATSRFDCAFDWRNNIVWRGSGNRIYGFTPSGAIAASFASPNGTPWGLTYYNRRLWVACQDDGYIYRVHCPKEFFAVEPVSAGRVKALFR